MKSMENILKDGTEKALRETKAWLTREDLRLKAMQRELEDMHRKYRQSRSGNRKAAPGKRAAGTGEQAAGAKAENSSAGLYPVGRG